MAEVKLQLDPIRMVRIGFLGVAVILGIVSIFTAWWGFTAKGPGGSVSFDAKPWSQGNFDSLQGDDLGTEVLITGILATLALLTLVAALVLEILNWIRVPFPGWMRHAAFGGAIALGLGAILYTVFAWPNGSAGLKSLGMGFWESSKPTPGTTLSTGAGLGWYLACVGFVLGPGIAYGLGFMRPSASTMPFGTAPAPVASFSDPEPEPAPEPSEPAPASASSPGPARRRVAVAAKKVSARGASKAK